MRKIHFLVWGGYQEIIFVFLMTKNDFLMSLIYEATAFNNIRRFVTEQ
jgi:hypothetical protein